MRGLLEKDIRLLLHSKQIFICFFAMALVFGITQESINTYMLGYYTFLVAALMASTLSYDEQDHGFAFLFTLPIDRKTYVREKYLLCIGGAVLTWFVTLLLYLAIMSVRHMQIVFWGEVWKGLVFLPMTILFLSVLIPVELKFGVEKSRFIVIGVSVLAGVMIYFLADKSGLLNGESTVILTVILSVLGLAGDVAIDVIGLVVAGCLAVVSYLCSCRIMKKKEL